jgi:2-polyprenyl-3-methyl-5-hydroxy-6-metoxy-1,4-benzoquinol methylase
MSSIPSLFYIIRARLAKRNFVYEFYCKGKKTLDVGCGEGEFLKHDKNLVQGFDPNERVVEKLTREGYQVHTGNAEHMPYKDGSFEVVHCHNVIEHVDIPAAYALLTESARVLQKGGHLVLSSEVVTKKFWDTFGHVKPYPPHAVLKLLRPESREEFEGIDSLEPAGLFYIGDFHPNKLVYLVKFSLGYLTPLFRREYFLVLKKR